MKFPYSGISDLQCATPGVRQPSRLNARRGHHTGCVAIIYDTDISPVHVYDWPHLLLGLIVGVLALESYPLAGIYMDEPIGCLVAANQAFIRSSSVVFSIVHTSFT